MGDNENTQWLRKYSADGEVIWTTAGSEDPNVFAAAAPFAVHPSGKLAAAGIAADDMDLPDFWVGAFNREGGLRWADRIDSGELGYLDFDAPRGVALGPDGSIVGVGRVNEGGVAVIRKYAPTGEILWTRTFEGDGRYRLAGVSIDTHESIVAIGSVGSGIERDGWILRPAP